MRKLEFLELLLKCGLCLPGSLNFSGKWYKSLWTVISILGIILTIGNGLLAFFNCPSPPKHPPVQDHNNNLPEISPGGNSIKPASTENSILQTMHSDFLPKFCMKDEPLPPPPLLFPRSDSQNQTFEGDDPGVIVEIVVSSYKLMLFVSNLAVRILVFTTFASLRNILHEIVTSSSYPQIEWLQAAEYWTKHEKVFLVLVAASLIERELEPLVEMTHMMSSPCSLNWPLVVFEVLQSQSQVLFSLDYVPEAVTLILMGFVGSFIFLFEKKAQDMSLLEERTTSTQVARSRSLDNLFVLTLRDHNDIMQKREGIKLAESPGWNKKIPQDSNSSGDNILCESLQEELGHKIEFYFEAVDLWKRCELATGSLSLVIFLELTTTFCLNSFVGIAAASASGGWNPRTLCSFFRAVIIIGKMICLATLAQALPDSMDNFSKRVLKLYWAYVESDTSLSRRMEKWTRPLDDTHPLEEPNAFLSDHSMSQVVAYIETNPVVLSALGYFSISKSTLTSVFGVIITYLVVLIQFHLQILQSEIKTG